MTDIKNLTQAEIQEIIGKMAVKIRKSTITLTELLSITMIGPLGKKLLNL